jgi:hypothetical protein
MTTYIKFRENKIPVEYLAWQQLASLVVTLPDKDVRGIKTLVRNHLVNLVSQKTQDDIEVIMWQIVLEMVDDFLEDVNYTKGLALMTVENSNLQEIVEKNYKN